MTRDYKSLKRDKRGEFVFGSPRAVPQDLVDAAAEDEAKRAPLLPEEEVRYWEPDAPTDAGFDDPYPDWDTKGSYVTSGPLGDTKFPGVQFDTWQGARAHASKLAKDRGVRMIRFWTIPGRWFARLGKIQPK